MENILKSIQDKIKGLNTMVKGINKKNAELLCRMAWKGAKNKKTDIDDWIIQVFNNEFDKCKKSSLNFVTKKDAKELCRICWWNARVNSEIYSSKIELWIKTDFSLYFNKWKRR
jgi:hypothetical protein